MIVTPEKIAALSALATRHNLDIRVRATEHDLCFDLLSRSRLAWIRTDLERPCELQTEMQASRYSVGKALADLTSDLAFLEPIMAEVDEQLTELPW